jgi:hypothetical protein
MLDREHVIPERPRDAQITLAQLAIRNNELATLRRTIASCKGGWFGNGVYLLHFAAGNGASPECMDLLATIAIAEGIHCVIVRENFVSKRLHFLLSTRVFLFLFLCAILR